MKKLIFFVVLFSCFIFFIATAVFVFLFIQRNNENESIISQNKELNRELNELKLNLKAQDQVASKVSFTDTRLGISFQMPSDWSLVQEVNVSEEFASDVANGLYGHIIESYTLNIQKSINNKITIRQIFGGVGDMFFGLDDETEEYEVIGNTNLVRYKRIGSGNYWQYSTYTKCGADAPEVLGTDSEYCSANFFPLYVSGFATVVGATVTDTSLLPVIDEIVLSLLN